MRAFAAVALVASTIVGCGKPTPTPTPPVPLPDPRTTDGAVEPPPEVPEAPADAGASTAVGDAGPHEDAGTADASVAVGERTGPVSDDADAVARASRAANVALQKAYADFVRKAKISESHPGPWVKAASSIKGNAKVGWDIVFQSAPPAGFSHEALVHVSPKGEVTVKRAQASFSSD